MFSVTIFIIVIVVLVFVGLACFLLWNLKNERDNALDELLKTSEEREKFRVLGQQYFNENKELSKYRGILDIEQKSNQIIQEARRESEMAKQGAARVIENARQRSEKITQEAQSQYDGLLIKIENAYKEYGYRKTLPDTHEKLKTRFDELKSKCDELTSALKEAKATGKSAGTSDKEREKLVAKFDKLGRSYIDDTFKFVVSKMTTSNYTASRDRVLKAVSLCRSLGFDWSEDIEGEYEEKVREEYKRVLRIEEMRLEQQRIKEQIREEQRAEREMELLKKQAEQFEKERENAAKQKEEMQKAMQKAIAEALEKANGEHTAAIQAMEEEMAQSIAEKEKEIAEKQKEIDDNQRAISNAQLTKAGHIYVISNLGSFGENVFKIGMTRRSVPEERVNELGGASVPFPFDVHLMVSSDNAPELEKHLHHTFRNYQINRVNPRKEFFKLDIDEVRNEIVSFLKKDVDYIADPHVLAEYAEQYRQSLETTLEDMDEVEKIMEEVGIADEVE